MNLEELREARRTERNRDGLQPLPETFYRDVAAYVADLKAERERAAEAADDPFSAPEVRRLTDEIESAEEIAQSLYERRVGKVVDRASFAAADKRHETEGLTAEERDLFDDLVSRIERNRDRVLDSLDPSAAADSGDSTDTAGSTPEATDAAGAASESGSDGAEDPTDAPDPSDLLTEAMGGSTGETGGDGGAADGSSENVETTGTTETTETTEATDGGTPRDGRGSGARSGTRSADAPSDTSPSPEAPTGDGAARSAAGGGGSAGSGTGGGSDGDNGGGGSATPAAPVAGTGTEPDAGTEADRTDPDEGNATRTTVYVTRDVGEIFGVDERTYRLAAEDVVDLPTDNARALVERDAAEPLE